MARITKQLAAAAMLVCMAVSASANPPPAPAERRSPKGGQTPASAPQPAAAAAAQPTQFVKISAEEKEHNARYDAAIAPLKALAPVPEDAARLKEAATAFARGDAAKGGGLSAQIKEPVAAKLAAWLGLRAGFGAPVEYREFLDRNPAWPDRTTLQQRMEEQVFVRGGPAGEIKAFFKSQLPRFGAGHAALASAHLADGEREKARALAAKAWRELDIASTLETPFLERFGALLGPPDHRARLDRLIVDDIRWAAERGGRAAQARRLVPLLDESERKAAEARLAVFMKSANALALMSAAKAAADDWGFRYHHAQALRRAERYEEAWRIIQAAPTDPARIGMLDEWWVERRANAYAALKAGKAQVAYALVRDAGPLSVNPQKDQAFTAGWIAFVHLKEPKRALEHFTVLRKAADGPLSTSRAEYWLARTHEALGDKGKALAHYKAGAQFFDTFHGQLCRLKADPSSQRLAITPPAVPSAEETARFNASDAVRAAVLAKRSGLDAGVYRAFLIQQRQIAKSEAELALVAHLAEALGDTQMAVRTGKAAIARGHNLVYYAYPIHPFPGYTPLRAPPETAFLLGIARQESEFNTQTVSGAGARGLLQVMPITARHVCTDYKLKCDIGRLLTDRPYNTMLASAYIGDRMKEFSGSYVLTLAGYNAGPGRARQWIREFGDPRDPKVDPIAWIERIPFQETREYVAKVLSNIQVYRARLGETATAMRLGEDLRRTSVQQAAPGRPGGDDAPKATAKSDG